MNIHEGKKDIYNLKNRYEWKIKEAVLKGIQGISKQNSEVLVKYTLDMERGLNISNSSRKGARSYSRLLALMQKLSFLAKLFEKNLKKNLSEVNEEDIHIIFNDMRTGKIKKLNGEAYSSVADYVKNFKAFWHYYIKIKKKEGKEIQDITSDLDTRKDKPDFVYFSEEQFKRLVNQANYEHKVLMYFLYDTGIRSPNECFNIKISDLINDYKELVIRQDISKTFERRIKLMLCNGLIKEYVREKGLKDNDFLFNFSPIVSNRYIKRLAKKVLGDKASLGGKKYSEMTMYDFRHSSCCYWLPRYKNTSALMYRFGWKNPDKINYYSEFLGMKDTIQEEDLMIDLTKTEIEKQLVKAQQERDLMQEQFNDLSKRFEKYDKRLNRIEKIKEAEKKS